MNFFVVTFLVAGQFERAVCDHFICIHIGARASTTLNRIDDELLIELACGNFVAGCNNCCRDVVGQFTDFLVCFCCCLFNDG